MMHQEEYNNQNYMAYGSPQQQQVPQYNDPLPPPLDMQTTQQDLDSFYSEDLSKGVPQSFSEQEAAAAAAQQQSQRQSSSSFSNRLSAIGKRLSLLEDRVILNSGGMSSHRHPKLFVRLTLFMVLLMAFALFMFLLFTPTAFPWFVPIWWFSLCVVAVLYISGAQNPLLGTRALSYHFVISILTSFTLIVCNEHASSYPWSFYPVGVLSLLLAIHMVYVLFPDYSSHFHIHAMIWFVGNSLLFLAWCYSRKGKIITFPWFFFPLVVWTILLAVHGVVWIYLKRRRDRRYSGAMESVPDTNNV
jgi:hypothetical protein